MADEVTLRWLAAPADAGLELLDELTRCWARVSDAGGDGRLLLRLAPTR